MKYFVKPHYSGWRETTKEGYEAFIKNIIENAIAMTEEQKEAYIKEHTVVTNNEGQRAIQERWTEDAITILPPREGDDK